MRPLFMILPFMLAVGAPSPIPYDKYPVYAGSDLGLRCDQTLSRFRLWSPTASAAEILFYKSASDKSPYKTASMLKGASGTWYARVEGNYLGELYNYRVLIGKKWSDSVADPYARGVSVNGHRSLIFDDQLTDPEDWRYDTIANFSRATDAVIYEMHIRDASIHPSARILRKGKFLGLTEENTHSLEGFSTGLAHLKELGVTHVHLLPFFDYNSVDESRPDSAQYNWGYDPLNYNVPEGSYSTDPFDGLKRIKELKQMIAVFHRNNLRVVMDVVYNHTALTAKSAFNQLVPGYYYRHKADSTFSDATGCGNETASERPMMQKFILESLTYWAREYHLDGFRFDLMGVHDITTMNLISDSLRRIRPDMLLYGEGWTAGDSPLPDSLRAVKKNVSKLHNIAVFNDDLRDGIKGSVFNIHDKGFVSGKAEAVESVKFGIVGACQHPQIDYQKVNYSKEPYAWSPDEVINYADCHDNNTLWDKLTLSCPDSSEAVRREMHKMAMTIVLTSQGIPFLHAGTEFLRTKKGVENSYKSPDSINAIDWHRKYQYKEVMYYVKTLIRIRKQHPSFRMITAAQIAENLRFDTTTPAGTLAYTLDGAAMQDKWKKIWVAFNATAVKQQLPLASGSWRTGLASDGSQGPRIKKLVLPPHSSFILYLE